MDYFESVTGHAFAGQIPRREPAIVSVLVASSDYLVGLDVNKGISTFVDQELRLPANDGPGVAPDGNCGR